MMKFKELIFSIMAIFFIGCTEIRHSSVAVEPAEPKVFSKTELGACRT